MITALRCNVPSFREVVFHPGFNVVLAERTQTSSQRDSRNGVGKTTLIEIIHFCLGSQVHGNQGLLSEQLKGWIFTLDLNIHNRNLTISRNTAKPNQVIVQGDLGGLQHPLNSQEDSVTLSLSDWNAVLGRLFFGLNFQDMAPKYKPTFRSLFSYFARRGKDAYSSPFTHHRNQVEWDKQVNNAFLLDLEWTHASQFQELKDQESVLNSLRRAARQGLLEGMIGTLGHLEAERTRLNREVNRQIEGLSNFRVHPQYHDIETTANELTADIQQRSNANLVDGRLLALYQESLENDEEPDAQELLQVYESVGVSMPDLVRRRLDDVQGFHNQILANRRDYLQTEIQRIESIRNQRQVEIQEAIDQRAELLMVLRTHGALDEYTRLQEAHTRLVAQLRDIDNRISSLKRFEEGKSEVAVNRQLLLQTTRREFNERRAARENAIHVFNSNSEALYEAPGNLELDVSDTGFRFNVQILRSGSQGIDNMKVFCYDIMLARLWANRRPSPDVLIHDSTIFDGVDERQIAHAIELAQRESSTQGFQYICALNSDTLPTGDLSSDFDIDSFVRIRLTDESEEGGLLGIRF